MISVVVPVYNCEEEVETCIRSILNNSCEFEIVAINDGSTDKSGQILDRLAEEEFRLRVIHQENQGNSHTRDTGIQFCKGEYILFVDADDEIEPNTLDRLNSYLDTETDLLVFGYRIDFVDEQYSVLHECHEETVSASESAVTLLEDGGFNLLWNKLYKAEIIRGHHDFPNMKTTGQDFIFNCHVYPRLKNVRHVSDVLYHYKKRKKETMVTRYLTNGYANLLLKKEALQEMLSAFGLETHQVYADYMLREFEVYTLNLFSQNCPLNKKEKVTEIRNNLLTEENLACIRQASPLGTYSKMFYHLASKNNAKLLVNSYTLLCGFRDRFGIIYRKLRKQINRGV